MLYKQGDLQVGTKQLRLKPPSFAYPKTALRLAAPDSYRQRINWTQLVIGILIAVMSIVGVWLFVEAQSQPTEVWVASERIEAGSVIEAGHLHRVSVQTDSTLSAIPAEQDIAQRIVRTAIPKGSTLLEGHFFDETDHLGQAGGQLGHVAVVFEEGRVPFSVRSNDLLRIQVSSQHNEHHRVFDPVLVHSAQHFDRHVVVTAELEHEPAAELLSALSEGQAWAAIVGRR